MSWAKLDDGFHAHPKLVRVGLSGFGVQARAFSYCGCYETDGLIPTEWVDELIAGEERRVKRQAQGDPSSLPELMIVAGLWEPTDHGFRVHDYLDYNPSREELHARREAERVRKEGRGSDVGRKPNGRGEDSGRT